MDESELEVLEKWISHVNNNNNNDNGGHGDDNSS